MLPKKRRIPKEDFSDILSNGVRFNSPRFLLYMAKMPVNKAQNDTRIAFSVSKKVCPNAVDRNRCRRLGYSSIEPVIAKIKNGYFLFFSFKKGSVPTTFNTIKSEVLGLLSTSGVLE